MVKINLQTRYRLGAITLCLLAAGCTDFSSRSGPMSRLQGSPRVQDLYQNRSPEVVRYDRYTLASTLPVDAQRDPLNQIIDIRMPLQMVNTIGEGMRYVMLESGYSLCSGEPGVFSELFVKPLPAVQRSIGPVKLGDALQILAGPAWRMRVDDLNREICFVLRDEYRHLALSTTGPLQASVASQGTGKSASTGTLLNSSKGLSGTGNNSYPLPPARPESSILSPGTPKVTSQAVSPLSVATTAKTPRNPFSASEPGEKSKVPVQKTQASPAAKLTSGKVKPSTELAPAPAPSALSVASTPLNKAALGVPLTPSGAVKPGGTVQNSNPPSTVISPTAPVSGKTVFTPGALLSSLPDGQAWTAQAGTTLKETLIQWATSVRCEGGSSPTWVVIWPTPVNYRIDVPFTLRGNFESVIVQLFRLYRPAEKPLYAAPNRLQCLVFVDDKPIQDGK
ncbi:integrating conjugative element protein PilL, PFGI-1 class [Enterobacter hormaechei subsp. hoffmannii UCI 50]|uniref:PFGI-1 class ICE element type IV pilus protein PilL2 n=1 Tax=Enterobacter hormaechei TaxID=158836 RepID=UPI00044DF90E|nr:TcpQ domain-containing protein [Enterobacter hormaechei]EUL33882.1 integrating conjugative element protein PilL, PFGI-1 class [Enterobacter hormaechei subsp. hoffmannii UCI 50]